MSKEKDDCSHEVAKMCDDEQKEEKNDDDIYFMCDSCELPVHGGYFHCEECKDFDVCISCHAAGEGTGNVSHHKWSHTMTLTQPKHTANAQRNSSLGMFESVSPPVTVHIFLYLAHSPNSLLSTVAFVNRAWNSLAKQQKIWQHLSRLAWPSLNSDLNVQNWLSFFVRRSLLLKKEYEHLQANFTANYVNWNTSARAKDYKTAARLIAHNRPENDVLHPIENCAASLRLLSAAPISGDQPWNTGKLDEKWEFECPVVKELLQRTEDPKIDFCTVCKSNVYLVQTQQELQERTRQGQCVSFETGVEFLNERKKRPQRKGKIKRNTTPR